MSATDTGTTPAAAVRSVNSAPRPPERAKAVTTGPQRGFTRLIVELLRPYRVRLAVVLAAILVETAASLAAPWPLKIVIDSVAGTRELPAGLSWLRALPVGQSQ